MVPVILEAGGSGVCMVAGEQARASAAALPEAARQWLPFLGGGQSVF